ncbi:MAG: hypothetical protein GX166_02015 [Clostridiaceae bacterium]|nr:hypothetical protein [Clostridiaceae bacterium]
MSYCVNCGVELRESESHCPLCDTKVVNPRKPYNENAERAYPRRYDVVLPAENRMMTALLATILTFLPALTCVIVDYVISEKATWSLYVAIAMGVLWSFVLPLVVVTKHRAVISLLIGTVSLSLGLFLIEKLVPVKGWFMPLALPIVVCAAFFILIIILAAKYVVFGVLKMMAFFFSFTALMVVVIEIVTDMYIDNSVQLQWSLAAFVPLVLVSLVLLIIERKKRVKDEMRKKFHI